MKTLLIALALTQATPDSLHDFSQPWTLRQCTEWALEHNLSVAAQQCVAQTQEVNQNTARMAWLPGVSASVGENLNFGRGLGSNNTYEYGNTASTSFSLGASMTLFDGLATPARMELARLNLEAATKELEKVRDDVSISVAKAYVQILYSQQILDVAREQVSIDSLQLERLQGMLQNGKASAAEVSQQRSSLAQSQLALVQARNNVRSAVLDMAQLLELPQWDGFSVQQPASAPEAVALPSPDDIYAEAVGLRPSIQAEELRLEGMDQSVRIAKAQ